MRLEMEFEGDFHRLVMAMFEETPFTLTRKGKDPLTIRSRFSLHGSSLQITPQRNGIGMASSSTSHLVFPVILPNLGDAEADLIIYFYVTENKGVRVFAKRDEKTESVILCIDIKKQ
jgi:hypothetical protein